MVNVDHTCDACGSAFSIRYEPEDTETDPSRGEYLILEQEDFDEDDDDEPL